MVSASSTAPVSGGGGAAAQRKLLVMVGGDDELLARCRPVFDTFADPVVHLGPLGAGQMAKLVNNLVFTALVSVGLETFAFADELGMDRVALAQVLASGSGGSRAAAILAGSGFDLSGLRQAAGNLHKDVGIMLDVARAGHASEPASLVELAQRTLATLGGGADLAHPEASAPSPARSRSRQALPSLASCHYLKCVDSLELGPVQRRRGV